ncbi:hypothetical protein FA13DRAFT_1721048 [Coprinellus micaceus]|uniref:Uncharacterized protein n=1 Tax=Coprinellus micaceus TaxID=71717 RepID=A0A4Y7S3Q4_COPMI|nr:hypothetical protein FA13DRAFT_1721048 [Coprinellus micaceus]
MGERAGRRVWPSPLDWAKRGRERPTGGSRWEGGRVDTETRGRPDAELRVSKMWRGMGCVARHSVGSDSRGCSTGWGRRKRLRRMGLITIRRMSTAARINGEDDQMNPLNAAVARSSGGVERWAGAGALAELENGPILEEEDALTRKDKGEKRDGELMARWSGRQTMGLAAWGESKGGLQSREKGRKGGTTATKKARRLTHPTHSCSHSSSPKLAQSPPGLHTMSLVLDEGGLSVGGDTGGPPAEERVAQVDSSTHGRSPRRIEAMCISMWTSLQTPGVKIWREGRGSSGVTSC